MAGPEMFLFLQAILVVTIILFSIFLAKLYEARSYVRRLRGQGFVSEKPVSGYRSP